MPGNIQQLFYNIYNLVKINIISIKWSKKQNFEIDTVEDFFFSIIEIIRSEWISHH